MIKAASLFSQILSTIRIAANFDNLVAKHEAEKNAKGFESKTQLVSMLFCHLAKADSLREIAGGLACCNGMMFHIGLKKAHRRSSPSIRPPSVSVCRSFRGRNTGEPGAE